MSRTLLSGLLLLAYSVSLADPVVFTDCNDFEYHISSCPSSARCNDANFQPTAYSSTYSSRFSINQGLLKFECIQLTDCPQGTYLAQLPYEISCPNSSNYATTFIDKFNELKENAAEQCGSIVGVDNQTVGESIPLTGSKFSLTYFTHMSGGRVSNYKFKVRLTDSIATPATDSYKLKIVKGNDVYLTETVLTNTANLSYTYQWNGKDLNGNVQVGPQKFTVITTQVFTDSSKTQIPLQQDVAIGTFNASALGLGGWMPSIYQFYSPVNGVLYSGNGKVRNVVAKSVTGQNGIAYSVAEEDGSLIYFFDSVGRIKHTKLGLTGNAVFTFNYNSNGTLASITEPFNLSTNFIRDAQGGLFAIVAPRGSYTPAYCDAKCYQEQGKLVTKFTLNSEGLIFGAWTLGMSKDFQMTYDSNGLLKTFKNRNGGISTFTYDGEGNLIKDQKNSGFFFDLVKSLVTPTSYRISSTTVGGFATTYDISDLGNGATSRTTTFPNGLSENYVFSKTSSENVFGGVSSQSTFSDDPRVEGARFPSSENTSYAGVNVSRTITKTFTPSSSGTPPWNIQSLVTKNKVGNSETVTTYNGAGLYQSVSPLGVVTETVIDSYERITSVKVGNLAPILYTYTGDLLTSVSQSSKTVNFTYDSMGFLQNISEGSNVTTTYVYDWDGNVLSMVDASGFSVKYVRDGEGNVTSLEIGPGEVVCGRRGCSTGPSQRTHTFSFNLNDAISTYLTPIVNGANLTTTYQYNSDKQLTKVTKPSGRYISSVYQPTTGVLTKFLTSEGDYDLTMNSINGQISSIKTPKNFTTSVAYAGTNVSGYSFKDSTNNEFGSYSLDLHPTLGIISSDKVKVGSTESQINYVYDADFNLKEAGGLVLTYDSNGQLASATIGSLVETFTRNASGRLEDYIVKYNGQNIFYELVRYDSADRIWRVSGQFSDLSIFQQTYSYYSGRLTGIDYYGGLTKDISYVDFSLATPAVINNSRIRTTYNGETATYFYSKDDRLERVERVKTGANRTVYYAYKTDGELESRTEYNTNSTPVLVGKTEYTYDIFGNLTKVILPDTRVIEYEIDGMNRRIGKKINGVLQKRWIYQDGLRISAELDASGNLVKRFVYATKRNVPDYMIMNGDTYKIVSNHQGSLRTVVKVSDGSVVAVMDHDEFGKVLRDTNPGLVPFGYAGGLYDPDTSLLRFGARDYDPEIGRWTSKDPILFGGGDTNLYGYTFNDPVNFIDPTGLDACGMNQSTGTVVCIDNNGNLSAVDRNGYSGNGAGKNNPSYQNVENTGPIPVGSYTIGASRPGGHMGPDARLLTPTPATRASFPSNRNPDTFNWHGDSRSNPGGASQGCPISGPNTRNAPYTGSPFDVNNISF